MLRLAMSAELHHQELFNSINIPETERHLALKAKNLFDIFYGVAPWDLDVTRRLVEVTDYADLSRLQWEHENNEQQIYDRLSILVKRGGMIIALEHRDLKVPELGIQKTISLTGGMARVFEHDPRSMRQHGEGSTVPKDRDSFERVFYFQTAANLGLYNHIQGVHEAHIESSSAILPNAA